MIETATQYHEKTSYRRDTIGGHSLDWDNQPFPFKIYPGEPIALPRETALPQGLLSTILKGIPFGKQAESTLSVETLAQVLRLTYSVTAKSKLSWWGGLLSFRCFRRGALSYGNLSCYA